MDLSLVVFVATTAAVCAGIVFTVRAFKASARGTGADKVGEQAAAAARAPISPHDPATTELLKRFFEGKECEICKRPIPPVPRTGLKPGLLNPTTHQTYSWDEIPTANLSTVLETHRPVCSACRIAESFRHRFPDRVLDRDRSQEAQRTDRIGAS
jgi:hypothetical protein